MDPPPAIPQAVELAPQGVMLFEVEGVWHILDWVGSSHYPNVADFVEEVRQMGMSRRLPKTLAFERLTLESRHFLVHSRAIVAHPEMYRVPHVEPDTDDTTGRGPYRCPHNIPSHAAGVEVGETLHHPMCAGIWWEDLDPCEYVGDGQDRKAKRRIPSGTYEGLGPPVEPRMREYLPGMFAAFPVWNLQVVRGGEHEAAAADAGRSGIDVEVVDE